MMKTSRTALLLAAAVLSTSFVSAAVTPSPNINQDDKDLLEKRITKGTPQNIYISDGENRQLKVVGITNAVGLDTQIDLSRFDNESFKACVQYTQLDPRVWPDLGPIDIDCYDSKQQFQNLIEQGDFTQIRVN